MKSISFGKALTLGCLICLALPVACGDDETDPPAKAGSGNSAGESGAAGEGGSGGGGGTAPTLPPGLSATPSMKACDAADDPCASAPLLGGSINVDPCCTAADTCGLSTGFLQTASGGFAVKCQALAQAADDSDDSCPDSAAVMVPLPSGVTAPLTPLPGCCRADTGTCGFVLDEASIMGLGPLGNLGLGCVDAAPFLAAGDEAAACGSGSGGSGGSGGGGGGGGEPVGGGGGTGGGGGGGGELVGGAGAGAVP